MQDKEILEQQLKCRQIAEAYAEKRSSGNSSVSIVVCVDRRVQFSTKFLFRPKYTIVGHRERAFERQRPFSIIVPQAAAAA